MHVVTAPRQSKQSRQFQVLWYEYKPPGYTRLCRRSPERLLPAKFRRYSAAVATSQEGLRLLTAGPGDSANDYGALKQKKRADP
jgi:hypothetical protein